MLQRAVCVEGLCEEMITPEKFRAVLSHHGQLECVGLALATGQLTAKLVSSANVALLPHFGYRAPAPRARHDGTLAARSARRPIRVPLASEFGNSKSADLG